MIEVVDIGNVGSTDYITKESGHFYHGPMNTNKLEIATLTSFKSTYGTDLIFENANSDRVFDRQAAVQYYRPVSNSNAIINTNLSLFHGYGITPVFTAANPGLDLNLWIQVTSADDEYQLIGQNPSSFALDHPGDTILNTESITVTNEDAGGAFFTLGDGEFFSSLTDTTIEVKTTGFVEFDTPVVNNDGGVLESGLYHYKFTLVYDNQYESPLNYGEAVKKNLPIDGSDTVTYYDPISLTIKLPNGFFTNLNRRVTGIGVWRKKDGGEFDDYYQYKQDHVIRLDNAMWRHDLTKDTYSFTITDSNSDGAKYSDLVGISQTIRDTSLNYGLSAIHHGYMYVTKAWHEGLGDDIKRYIFKSQPFNYFAFNWTDDNVILPEVPIAMTSFNSRLYVWGKSSLYKIDPYSLMIEDEFKGISIANKNAYIKTEFGLCFFDENNIYLHDGNKPNPIGNAILYSSEASSDFHIDNLEGTNSAGNQGYIRIEQGFRELLISTINNGDSPNIHYLGKKHSFVITLSNEHKKGILFAYNLIKNRWDIWEGERPKSSVTGENANVLLNDGNRLYNILGSTSLQYHQYHKLPWDWHSNQLTFGADNQEKVFKTLSLSGTPSVFNYDFSEIAQYSTETASYNGLDYQKSRTNSIQAYIDDKQVDLVLYDKFYGTTNLGKTIVYSEPSSTTSTVLSIRTELRKVELDSSISSPDNDIGVVQEYIRPGHLIKIKDEIMFVLSIDITKDANLTNNFTTLGVIRNVMGTTAGTNYNNESVYIVSPKFKFPTGSKGKRLQIRLKKQEGYVDSIGVTYKVKAPK